MGQQNIHTTSSTMNPANYMNTLLHSTSFSSLLTHTHTHACTYAHTHTNTHTLTHKQNNNTYKSPYLNQPVFLFFPFWPACLILIFFVFSNPPHPPPPPPSPTNQPTNTTTTRTNTHTHTHTRVMVCLWTVSVNGSRWSFMIIADVCRTIGYPCTSEMLSSEPLMPALAVCLSLLTRTRVSKTPRRSRWRRWKSEQFWNELLTVVPIHKSFNKERYKCRHQIFFPLSVDKIQWIEVQQG